MHIGHSRTVLIYKLCVVWAEHVIAVEMVAVWYIYSFASSVARKYVSKFKWIRADVLVVLYKK